MHIYICIILNLQWILYILMLIYMCVCFFVGMLKGLLRCGKSCRLRWINYLRGDLKRGNITQQEEEMIVRLHTTFGNRLVHSILIIQQVYIFVFFFSYFITLKKSYAMIKMLFLPSLLVIPCDWNISH